LTRRRIALALLAAAMVNGCGLGPAVPLPAPKLDTERGIGGTGIDVAERGIGGTGIIGVITVDGTIAVAGQEIATDSALPVRIDGRPAGIAALRSGQVVAVAAEWQQGRLQARALTVRHEVSGPVERVLAAGEELVVAGQTVRLDRATQPGKMPRRGDWVAVSGLRDADGIIRASRIDPRVAGEVSVSGLLDRAGRLGELPLTGADLPPPGQRVSVTGRYAHGVLQVRAVRADPVLAFPPAVGRFLVEAYPRREDQRLRLAPGLSVMLGPSFTGIPAGEGPVVVALVEAEHGLMATGVQDVGGGSQSGNAPGGQESGPAAGPGSGGPGSGGPGSGAPGSGGHGHGDSGDSGPAGSGPGGEAGGKDSGGQGGGGQNDGSQGGGGGSGSGGHGGGQGGGGHGGGGQDGGGSSGHGGGHAGR
jgi:hypothetical protein